MKTILFVDDEKGMHDLLRVLFKNEVRHGEYEMKFMLSGKQCIDFIENTKILSDLIVLTDITMPEMDGFELLSSIKTHYPHIPVIVISAYESTMYKEKAKNLGAISYFTKPLDIDNLKVFLKQL